MEAPKIEIVEPIVPGPVLRWAGSKRTLAPYIADIARRHLAKTEGRYLEPFLGGAAVALALNASWAILGDLCGPLMNTYHCLALKPRLVVTLLEGLVKTRGTDQAAYLAVREQASSANPNYEAARFLYLNASCFNGLHRENSKGEFNVPYGFRKRAPFLSLEQAEAFAQVMIHAELCHADFVTVVQRAQKGDFIFADPPYHGGFVDYVASGFSLADQELLAKELHEAIDRGAAFLTTNSDHVDIRRLYSWAHILGNKERRSVAANGKKRGDADCLIVTSHRDLTPEMVLS